MTGWRKRQVVKLAREAGMFYRELEDEFANANTDGIGTETLERFAELVRADEALAQRTWVGLTDDEIDHFCHLAYTGDEELVLTIQAKLKEKNA